MYSFECKINRQYARQKSMPKLETITVLENFEKTVFLIFNLSYNSTHKKMNIFMLHYKNYNKIQTLIFYEHMRKNFF